MSSDKTTQRPAATEHDESSRRVFTVSEAASVLGISKSLAYELIARAEIPAVRLGRRIIVPAQAIDAVLARALGASA